MNDYHSGKIYKVICKHTGVQYVGSTTLKLTDRLHVHTSSYKRWQKGKAAYLSVFKVMEHDNYGIELLEEYPCANKEQLRQRERYWQERTECVNKIKAYASAEEKLNDRRTIHRQWVDTLVECSCGGFVRQGTFKAHQQSKRHANRKAAYDKLTPYKWKQRLIYRALSQK